jgi:polar amino acid transport system substrate-binding protein
LAVLIGLGVALGRLYAPRVARIALTAYVEVLRGTPLLLQLFVIFYLIPSLVTLPEWLSPYFPLVAAVMGLAINYSAYEAEIYRAGLLAIPPGQTEAALALGMSHGQALRHVVVPQAVRLVIPPVTNDFIALFKDTSVCSVITVIELSKRYSIVANNTGAYVEIAAVTALLYLIMSYPLALLTRRLERQTRSINV